MNIRVVVADDEAPARRKLERFLAEHGDLDLVGQAADGIEAIDVVERTRPHVLFLDIQMPGLDGLGVAQRLDALDRPPAIVFVTAFDRYAVKAFEVRALDYLLKPFDRGRFERTLERVRASGAEARAAAPLAGVISALRPDEPYARRLLVPGDGRSFFIATRDIVRLESDRNNVVVFSRAGRYEVRATLESLEERLDPQQFARVHRCHIVNIDDIAEIHPWFHGDHRLRLRDGTEIAWSRRYAARRSDLLR